MATAAGISKKTLLKAYGNPQKRGIIAIGLDKGDTVIGVGVTNGNDQIVLATTGGMAVRFEETEVRDMGRQAGGVKGVELEKDDRVVAMVIVPHGLDQGDNQVTLLTACENGFGKRTRIEEYRLTHRGGKGVINIRTTERNGPVVAVRAITDSDELMMITRQGQVVRIGVTGELREMGRATQGVRLIKLEEGDILVGMARVIPEESDGADSSPLLDPQ
jgi:DNA gyrase subunit A